MAGEHQHRTSSWIVVALMSIGFIVLGVAFVLQNLPLAIVGGVVLVAGAVMGGVTRIMDDAY